jgi:imidazolonepropionase
MSTILFHNARIFTPLDAGQPAAGENQGKIQFWKNGALLVKDGRIAAVGNEGDVRAGIASEPPNQEVDLGGRCVIPGFVDPHTHMCFAERREVEFEQRIAGTPYMEILAQGGGILSSVRSVRAADEEALFAMTLRTVQTAMGLGTTTVEIKSGYGLDTESELKMLRVIGRVAEAVPADVVPTFLGAHAVPQEFKENPDAFVDVVVTEMLPAVAEQGIARFCDVFCETGVFSIEQSRRILSAAKEHGLDVKLHADEVNDLGGAGLAAEISAVSADHLLASNPDNLARMAEAGVVANLLPATAYSLRKPYARARDMIAAGVPIALATDGNPGSSYTESMPFVIGLAVMAMHLTPAEALTAATLNAAYALKLSDRVGSLDAGKQADFLVLDGESPAILAYHAGVSPVVRIFKVGKQIAGNLE